MEKEADRVVAVYDLGGGTFDISVLEIQGLTDTLDGHTVAGKVDTGLLLELVDDVADEVNVED
jgi:molecular chaperone DnaK (HSP70)